jgi:hypothetical protein
MDTNMDQSLQFVSIAETNRDQMSTRAGDFINSGELEKHMPMAMEMIMNSGGLGLNPFPSGMPTSNQIPSSQIPANAENLSAIPKQNEFQSEARSPQSNMGLMPMNNMPTQSLGEIASKVSSAANTSNGASKAMPEQKVLSEPCTVNQPMNASLRDNYSIGTFYFLK